MSIELSHLPICVATHRVSDLNFSIKFFPIEFHPQMEIDMARPQNLDKLLKIETNKSKTQRQLQLVLLFKRVPQIVAIVLKRGRNIHISEREREGESVVDPELPFQETWQSLGYLNVFHYFTISLNYVATRT